MQRGHVTSFARVIRLRPRQIKAEMPAPAMVSEMVLHTPFGERLSFDARIDPELLDRVISVLRQ